MTLRRCPVPAAPIGSTAPTIIEDGDDFEIIGKATKIVDGDIE